METQTLVAHTYGPCVGSARPDPGVCPRICDCTLHLHALLEAQIVSQWRGILEALSITALLLLVMVGYSLGSVSTIGHRKAPSPTLLDLGIVSGLCALALILRPTLGKWGSIGAWLIAAILVAASRTRFSTTDDPPQEIPTIEAHHRPLWQKLWDTWKALAAEMGNYQGRLLLAFFYFIIITPWGILLRLLSDPLNTHPSPISSFWLKRSDSASELEDARKQF